MTDVHRDRMGLFSLRSSDETHNAQACFFLSLDGLFDALFLGLL
jgi:hypothetical protein